MNEADIVNLITQMQPQVVVDKFADLKLLTIQLTLKLFAALTGVLLLRVILSGFDKRLGLDFKNLWAELTPQQKIDYIRWRLIAASLIVSAAII